MCVEPTGRGARRAAAPGVRYKGFRRRGALSIDVPAAAATAAEGWRKALGTVFPERRRRTTTTAVLLLPLHARRYRTNAATDAAAGVPRASYAGKLSPRTLVSPCLPRGGVSEPVCPSLSPPSVAGARDPHLAALGFFSTPPPFSPSSSSFVRFPRRRFSPFPLLARSGVWTSVPLPHRAHGRHRVVVEPTDRPLKPAVRPLDRKRDRRRHARSFPGAVHTPQRGKTVFKLINVHVLRVTRVSRRTAVLATYERRTTVMLLFRENRVVAYCTRGPCPYSDS